jgi:DNA modification methylase
MIKLVNKDYKDYLKRCKPFRMAFADPPDNIGLKYNGFKDKMDDFAYTIFLQDILYHSMEKADVIWLSLNSRHAFTAGKLIGDMLSWNNGRWEGKSCIQTFTFGQHNHNDLGNNHRLLYRLMKTGTELYPDAIRVPSWRQLNGDKRADPRGRVPGDVFDFPRVTGNSKQRRAFSPTQLHEGLYERCIKLTCASDDTVVDLFAGSGTLGRVCNDCGVNGVMVELSTETCQQIAADQGIKKIW